MNLRFIASLCFFALVACGGKVAGAPNDGPPDTGSPPTPDPGETPPSFPVDKLDVLVVVDNAPQSADVEAKLADALPQMLGAITSAGRFTDVHLAVISSSLGSFGTSACDPSSPHQDDRAYAMPRAGSADCPGITADSLAWTTEGDATVFSDRAACVVRSVGSDGCSYPQPLEAAYRFLVDPDPYQSAKVDCVFGPGGDSCGTNKIDVTGLDDAVLARRKAFLRPDSEVLVVFASALDDMSLRPAQLNWLPWAYAKGQMQPGWDSCARIPDDFEPETGDDFNALHTTYDCRSCFEDASNPACSVPFAIGGPNLDVDARPLRNLLDTKRFGYNFLYGRQRFVDGFSAPVVPGIDAGGSIVGKSNPLFDGGLRTRGMIHVVGFVGVPQTISIASEADWQRIVSADPSVRDPHMIPSIAPRASIAKFVGDRGVDPVNGGDRDVPNGDEIQWACLGKRTTPSATARCTSPSSGSDPSCDGPTQTFFGATPALRIARVLHALGGSGRLVSACDADATNALKGIAASLP